MEFVDFSPCIELSIDGVEEAIKMYKGFTSSKARPTVLIVSRTMYWEATGLLIGCPHWTGADHKKLDVDKVSWPERWWAISGEYGVVLSRFE